MYYIDLFIIVLLGIFRVYGQIYMAQGIVFAWSGNTFLVVALL
jgi:hypothetical protein